MPRAARVRSRQGGVARDGTPRRVAFISIEPSNLPSVVPYDSRFQWHAVQYWHSVHRLYERAQVEPLAHEPGCSTGCATIEPGRLGAFAEARRGDFCA